MKHLNQTSSLPALPLASVIAALLAAPVACAANYHWDSNGTVIGFGTGAVVSGAWTATTPGPSEGWTTNSNGTAAIGSVTTATTDNLFFGNTAWALNSGTVTVSGSPVNAGNLTFSGGTYITLSAGTINLASPSTIATNSFGDTTIKSVLSGTGGMTRTGLGNLILTGANDYTGATILSGVGTTTIKGAGALSLTSGITFNGALLVLSNETGEGGVDRLKNTATITSNGGILNYFNSNIASNTYAETVGTLALTSGQFNAVLVAYLNTASTTQTLTFGDLTRTGATNTSAVTFSANTTGPEAAGNKHMFVVAGKGTTATGQIIGAWATTGIGNAPSSQRDYAVYSSDYVVPANIAASTENNWTTPANAYTMTGGSTLGATRTITALRATATGAAQTLNLGQYNLQTSGLLNGGTGQVGSCLLTVNTVNGALTTASGGGQLHLTAGSNAAPITVNAPINNNNGTVTLVKNGLGTVSLTDARSDYSGGTVINSGTLNFANGTLGLGGITINGGSHAGLGAALGSTNYGRLQWATGNTQDISAKLIMVDGGNANLDTNGNTVVFDSVVGSNTNSNLTKVGAGQLTLNKNNTYTGETGVYLGTLLVNVAQTNTTSIRVGNSTANGSTANVGGATLKLGTNNGLPTNIPVMVYGQESNFLDLNGFNQTIGHLTLGSYTGTFSGTVTGSGSSRLTLTAGATVDGHGQGASYVVSGVISVGYLDLDGATQNFNTVNPAGQTDGRAVFAISSVIQNGGINKTGIGGQLRLSGDNTFSGNTTISGGVIRLDNSLALKNSALDTANSVLGNVGGDSSLDGLRLNTGVTTVTLGGLIGNKNFAATGGVFSTNTTADKVNNYHLVTALTLNPGIGMTHSYSGVIANGATGMTLTKTGGGTQVLSNSNTYSGGTIISQGTLEITGTTQSTNSISFASGGVLGLVIGSPVTASSAVVNLTDNTIKVTGPVDNSSDYQLMTAASFSGTPTLNPAITNYTLELRNTNKELWLKYNGSGGNPYDTWAIGSEPFDGDANGDGVADGLAWILNTKTPATNALNKLPVPAKSGSFLTLDFQRVNPYAPAQLIVQFGNDLVGWTEAEIPAATGTVVLPGDDITVEVTAGTPNTVKVKIPTSYQSASGAMFARLRAKKN